MKSLLNDPAGYLRLNGKRRLFLFLDFDGTISPIRKRPADATLPAGTRRLLEELSSRKEVRLVIITGRSVADIRRRAGLKGAIYAGCHGLEIRGGGINFSARGLRESRRAIKALSRALKKKLSGVKGVIIEDKGATLSVHYRMVPAAKRPAVLESVREAASRHIESGLLRAGGGKMIVEIKPAVEWDKGKAALHILKTLADKTGGPPAIIYVGDDLTDEDAFRALRGRGVTIRVGSGKTAAQYSVKGTGAVTALLRSLVKAYANREG